MAAVPRVRNDSSEGIGIFDQLAAVYGQRAQAHAGGRENGIAESGRRDRGAQFPEAPRRLLARDPIHLHGGYLVHAQVPVVMKVALLHGTILQGDGAVERGAQAEQHAALHLRLGRTRIDDDAAIDRDDRAAQLHLSLRRDLRFHDQAYVAAKG